MLAGKEDKPRVLAQAMTGHLQRPLVREDAEELNG